MNPFIIFCLFVFSFASYGTGIVEAVGTMAIQQELAKQSLQDGRVHVEQARKKTKEYEDLQNKKKQLLEEAMEASD